jgi:hypothetical protein
MKTPVRLPQRALFHRRSVPVKLRHHPGGMGYMALRGIHCTYHMGLTLGAEILLRNFGGSVCARCWRLNFCPGNSISAKAGLRALARPFCGPGLPAVLGEWLKVPTLGPMKTGVRLPRPFSFFTVVAWIFIHGAVQNKAKLGKLFPWSNVLHPVCVLSKLRGETGPIVIAPSPPPTHRQVTSDIPPS